MKTRDVERGYVLALERGEECIATLTDFCQRRGIHAAVFQGIGALERVEVGYYDLTRREYYFRSEDGVYEVASMQGNVALVDGRPFVHAHAVLSRCDETLACIGAHLKVGYVAVTLEVFMTPLDTTIERRFDEGVGLMLLHL